MAVAGKVNGQAITCPALTVDAALAPPSLRELDGEASQWLISTEGRQALADLKTAMGSGVEILTHLPSGRVAAPARASLSETKDYQLALITDRAWNAGGLDTWSVDVNVTQCPARDTFRVNGDFAALKSDEKGKLQARTRSFALVAVDQPLRCGAGDMKYTMQVTGGAVTGAVVPAAWRIRPVYHLTASFGSGFDFATKPTYAVVSQKVTLTDRTAGLTGAAGFIWYPGGVDFENMRAYQHALNPFVLFDLNAPKDGFIVGTALTASGGLSIGLGMSVRKVAVLKSNRVGDAFTGTGDVPTELAWTRDGVGAYIGMIFDTSLFAKLNGLVAAAK